MVFQNAPTGGIPRDNSQQSKSNKKHSLNVVQQTFEVSGLGYRNRQNAEGADYPDGPGTLKLQSKHVGKTPFTGRHEDGDLGQTERVSQRDVRASNFLDAEYTNRLEYATLDAKMDQNTGGGML